MLPVALALCLVAAPPADGSPEGGQGSAPRAEAPPPAPAAPAASPAPAPARPAPSPKPRRIAVMDIDTTGVAPDLARSAGLLLPTLVRRQNPSARVISAEEIRSMLGFERQKQLLGCTESAACVAEIGGSLGVDEMVTGRLGRIGDTFILELRRIDVRHAAPIGSAARTVTGSQDALVWAVQAATAELYGAAPPTPQDFAIAAPTEKSYAGAYWGIFGGSALLLAGVAAEVFRFRAVGPNLPAPAGGGTVYLDAHQNDAVIFNVALVGGAVAIGTGGSLLGWGIYARAH